MEFGVTIRHGIKIDSGGVELENGLLNIAGSTETIQADLFVGVDGSQPVTQEALTGCKVRVVPMVRLFTASSLPRKT